MPPDVVHYDRILATFSKARERMEGRRRFLLRLGDLKLEVETGEKIVEQWLKPALAPVMTEMEESGEDADIRLCIALGREAEGMEALCSWVGKGLRRSVYENLEHPEGKLLFEHTSQFWGFWSPQRREAFLWLSDLAHLEPGHMGYPLMGIFHWICAETDLQLIHGGGVGRKDGGVLLAGLAGSGKSTTALACLGSGLDYLADDHCLVRSHPSPTAYQLYSTARLRPDNLHRFENIRSRFAWQPERLGAKPTAYLDEAWAGRSIASFPIRAILLPRVNGQKETFVVRTAQGNAWKAIAPSTFMQSPDCGDYSFSKIAAISSSVPVYELRLGTDLQGIPIAIKVLLDELAG